MHKALNDDVDDDDNDYGIKYFNTQIIQILQAMTICRESIQSYHCRILHFDDSIHETETISRATITYLDSIYTNLGFYQLFFFAIIPQ